MWRANDNSERRNHELLIASAAMSRVPGQTLPLDGRKHALPRAMAVNVGHAN